MQPRSPFVVSIHDLVRRPGATRSLELEIPAPADLRNEVIGVPAGAPIQIDLRLDSVVEGVVAAGELTAPLVGECVRCLTEVTPEIEADFSELFAYPGAIELDPEDDEAEDIQEVHEDAIDLEQVVRDAVGLALPFQPYCKPDCLGLCSECGIDLNTAPADHGHDVVDARWAALVEAFGDGETNSTPGSDSDR